jgi:toxin ParE1/3/4
MPADVIWSRQARADLLDIYVLIGLEQQGCCRALFRSHRSEGRFARSQPRIGVRRRDIRPMMRMLAPYLILYRTDPDTDEGPIATVEIVRVVDGRRALSRLF